MPSAFATVLNCMDGRVQMPANEYLRSRFGCTVVDTITEAGIVRFLADAPDAPETRSALEKVRISTAKHGSTQVAVVAHADCAGNPVSDDVQMDQVRRAAALIRQHFPDCEVLPLWLDADGAVHDVPADAG